MERIGRPEGHNLKRTLWSCGMVGKHFWQLVKHQLNKINPQTWRFTPAVFRGLTRLDLVLPQNAIVRKLPSIIKNCSLSSHSHAQGVK